MSGVGMVFTESEWATCPFCQQVMEPGVGCTAPTYDDFADGVRRPRVPHVGMVGDRCHDCNVHPGQLHHPGCDMERCPSCGRQAISCECISTGEDDEEDDE